MEIHIQDLGFSHGDTPIIRDLSCSFFPNTFYGILGPNGSGKTTLLDLISGFLIPDRGQVLLDRTDISSLTPKKIAQALSLVSQNYYINFPFSVEEVIMMGRHPYIDRFAHPCQTDMDRVSQVMDITGISHLKHRKITELSGGEKQRCIFARALCQDTPVLLLDEAFSNMDINHTLHMLGIIRELINKTKGTVICVLHDLNLAAAWADEILFLKNGTIQAKGKTSDIITQETIEQVFNVKSKVEFNEYVQAKQVYFKTI
ncbi:MAG: ABC transporter ATP-binding protein [Proteobacteria bacterium]|nr:ABC transporter ATP-binding protein [Desulfobacula sp.]MBU3951066.1 ABC transporter ATP-binding protein [Pseudomonadota bacterium]MBU4133544.1 ABC transporter ATP-binding protein [Pseudomonadota bacterium]